MTIILCIVGWIVCGIIVTILTSKIEKEPIDACVWVLFIWPIVLILLIFEACETYIFYIKTRKERTKKLKQEKRDKVEEILKEI